MIEFILNPYLLVNIFWMFIVYVSINNICHWFGNYKS
jgi:hypothetical protein